MSAPQRSSAPLAQCSPTRSSNDAGRIQAPPPRSPFRSARPQELFAVHAHLDASRPYDERMRIAFDGRHPQIDEDAADEPRPLRRSQDNDPFTTLHEIYAAQSCGLRRPARTNTASSRYSPRARLLVLVWPLPDAPSPLVTLQTSHDSASCVHDAPSQRPVPLPCHRRRAPTGALVWMCATIPGHLCTGATTSTPGHMGRVRRFFVHTRATSEYKQSYHCTNTSINTQPLAPHGYGTFLTCTQCRALRIGFEHDAHENGEDIILNNAEHTPLRTTPLRTTPHRPKPSSSPIHHRYQAGGVPGDASAGKVNQQNTTVKASALEHRDTGTNKDRARKSNDEGEGRSGDVGPASESSHTAPASERAGTDWHCQPPIPGHAAPRDPLPLVSSRARKQAFPRCPTHSSARTAASSQ
ncbi:hypothetical protein VTO73DRAFT_8364 [Trametes versicolor]